MSQLFPNQPLRSVIEYIDARSKVMVWLAQGNPIMSRIALIFPSSHTCSLSFSRSKVMKWLAPGQGNPIMSSRALILPSSQTVFPFLETFDPLRRESLEAEPAAQGWPPATDALWVLSAPCITMRDIKVLQQ